MRLRRLIDADYAAGVADLKKDREDKDGWREVSYRDALHL